MPVEKYIEQHLVRSITRMGGLCVKLNCPGFAGMPDRLILMPGGRIAFAETKAPGKKERPIHCAVWGTRCSAAWTAPGRCRRCWTGRQKRELRRRFPECPHLRPIPTRLTLSSAS